MSAIRMIPVRALKPTKYGDRIHDVGDEFHVAEDIIDTLHKFGHVIVETVPDWLDEQDPTRARRLATPAAPWRGLDVHGHIIELQKGSE